MDFVAMLMYFGLFFLIFLAIREIVCWYFKINDIVPLLRSIDKNLKRMNRAETNCESNSVYQSQIQDHNAPMKVREVSGREKTLRAIGILVIIAAIILLAKYL